MRSGRGASAPATATAPNRPRWRRPRTLSCRRPAWLARSRRPPRSTTNDPDGPPALERFRIRCSTGPVVAGPWCSGVVERIGTRDQETTRHFHPEGSRVLLISCESTCDSRDLLLNNRSSRPGRLAFVREGVVERSEGRSDNGRTKNKGQRTQDDALHRNRNCSRVY